MYRPFAAALACAALVAVACGQSEAPAPPEEESAPVNPMTEYGMTASNVFLYYADVEAANEFYTRTLGFAVAADYGFAKILRVGPSSFITLVDEEMGMHSASDPKTVAHRAHHRPARRVVGLYEGPGRGDAVPPTTRSRGVPITASSPSIRRAISSSSSGSTNTPRTRCWSRC